MSTTGTTRAPCSEEICTKYSVTSVKQGRYRLRKKLQTEGNDIADLLADESPEATPVGTKI